MYTLEYHLVTWQLSEDDSFGINSMKPRLYYKLQLFRKYQKLSSDYPNKITCNAENTIIPISSQQSNSCNCCDHKYDCCDLMYDAQYVTRTSTNRMMNTSVLTVYWL